MIVGKIKEVSNVVAPAKLENRHLSGFPTTSSFSKRIEAKDAAFRDHTKLESKTKWDSFGYGDNNNVINESLQRQCISMTEVTNPPSSNVNLDVRNDSRPLDENENNEIIASMTEEERLAAIESISSIISPSNLEFLRLRSMKQTVRSSSTLPNTLNTNKTIDTKVHVPKIENSIPKLSSNLKLPAVTSSVNDLFKSKCDRFDLDGRKMIICTSADDILYTELYNAFFPIMTRKTSTDSKRNILNAASNGSNKELNDNKDEFLLKTQLDKWNEILRKQFIDLVIVNTKVVYNRGSVLDELTGGYVENTHNNKVVNASDDRELYNHERDPMLPGYTMEDISEVRYSRVIVCILY